MGIKTKFVRYEKKNPKVLWRKLEKRAFEQAAKDLTPLRRWRWLLLNAKQSLLESRSEAPNKTIMFVHLQYPDSALSPIMNISHNYYLLREGVLVVTVTGNEVSQINRLKEGDVFWPDDESSRIKIAKRIDREGVKAWGEHKPNSRLALMVLKGPKTNEGQRVRADILYRSAVREFKKPINDDPGTYLPLLGRKSMYDGRYTWNGVSLGSMLMNVVDKVREGLSLDLSIRERFKEDAILLVNYLSESLLRYPDEEIVVYRISNFIRFLQELYPADSRVIASVNRLINRQPSRTSKLKEHNNKESIYKIKPPQDAAMGTVITYCYESFEGDSSECMKDYGYVWSGKKWNMPTYKRKLKEHNNKEFISKIKPPQGAAMGTVITYCYESFEGDRSKCMQDYGYVWNGNKWSMQIYK